jgi:hypothetical protein
MDYFQSSLDAKPFALSKADLGYESVMESDGKIQ